MGLLDDAIREHLELKRQHGADPDEVERQEREVLGAVRQAEFAAAEDGEAVSEEAEAPSAAEPEEPEAPFDAEDEPAAPAEEAEPPTDEAARAPGYEEDPWLDSEPDEVPAEEKLDRAEKGEDVLEETPEFLQETPEHDRLWFEQRPPRDFDWDK